MTKPAFFATVQEAVLPASARHFIDRCDQISVVLVVITRFVPFGGLRLGLVARDCRRHGRSGRPAPCSPFLQKVVTREGSWQTNVVTLPAGA
jgi:hypothetical protein